MLCRLFHHDILCNPTCCPTLATSSKKPCASPCTLNMSPLDQHMVRKLSSAAAQGTACRDEPESVRRKQAFRPEQGRALLQPTDTLHTYEWHICRKVQAPASQGCACQDVTQSVGTDLRAASFHPDLSKKPAACHTEWSQAGCVCMEGHASCRCKGSKMVWPWHAVQAVPPWYIVLSNTLSNMLSNIVNITNKALLQPMHTERERI